MTGERQPVRSVDDFMLRMSSEEGAIGYIFLWFLGVPASLLFLVFLLRGCT